ncbi:MAG: tetratricopeptide repeat protein [Myxococcales bacterium]|nr:tetratricopeptide repeat protein [Myxococcales bacterium]
MDVRCEKCQTVYEFEDAKVTGAGVTVKCTQCGNLFKVRRRTTATNPVIPTARTLPGEPPDVTPAPQFSRTVPAPGTPRHTPSRGTPPLRSSSGEDRTWLVRSAATGDVKRFRELTTLQQWIVEKKVSRDDEISRSGETWKRLGGIAELASFFHVVEQAETRPTAAYPILTDPVDPALATTAPMGTPTYGMTDAGPRYHGADPSIPKVSPTVPTLGYTPTGEPMTRSSQPDLPAWGADFGASSQLEIGRPVLASDEELGLDEVPRAGIRGATLLAIFALLLLVGGAGYLALFRGAAVKRLFTGDEGPGHEAWRKGREYLLLDADDSLRLADQQLQRAHGADESNALPVAALAEVNALWAGYLRDDGKLADQAQQSARGDELRRQAQSHLDDAKRYANEALSLAPDDPEVNRAVATFLLVDGAPAAQVEGHLRRSDAGRPDDPEVAFVRGALGFRDGQLGEARTHLEQASRLNLAKTQHDLMRAQYLLARIAVVEGRRDDAVVQVRKILDANAAHQRARGLQARLEAQAPDGGAAGPVAPVAAPVPPKAVPVPPAAAAPSAPVGNSRRAASSESNVVQPIPGAPPVAVKPAASALADVEQARRETPLDPKKGEPPVVGNSRRAASLESNAEPKGLDGLLAQGNRLLERGKAKDAQKLFEKALALQPSNVEALNGMGYCHLDTEHFGAAIDKFKQALATMPGNGDAILGVAGAYKMRGDKNRALEYYKKYLAELPSGSKAGMAQANVSELETAIRRTGTPTATEVRDAPPLDKNDNKPQSEPPP